MRVLTIFVRYGTDLYPGAEQRVSEIYLKQMPEVERDLLVVDNACPAGVIEQSGRRTVIGGDNTYREFSGFDRAIEYAGNRLRSYDLVHFVTEAFYTLYVDYLDRFDTHLLGAIVGRSLCVGHLDCYNEPVSILSFHSQHWIRTCFFFMAPSDAIALGSFVTLKNGDRLFSHLPATPFRPDAPISANYQRYLVDWITGRDIGQGVKWHSSFALTSETLPSFERKALYSIINEHLLSIRLRAMGCRVTDVTWLATVLRSRRAVDVRWDTPWQGQLAEREHSALVVLQR